MEAIDDFTPQTLALTLTVSTEAEQNEETDAKSEFTSKVNDDDAKITELESPSTTSDHMYDYFNTGGLASFCEDEASVDSVLKARLVSAAEYNCNALLTGSHESPESTSRYIDLDDYCASSDEEADLSNSSLTVEAKVPNRSTNDEAAEVNEPVVAAEVNEPVVMSKEVAVINSHGHPNAEPYVVPPEKARCGSCIIL